MKRVLIFVLALTLLFGTLAASAVPPGQANRKMNSNQEELYGPFGMLPPGLAGKFIPPGLWKRNLDLPPGMQKRLDQGYELPPGIMMRFMQTWQWRHELGYWDNNETTYGEARNLVDLEKYLKDEKIEVILLKDNIKLTEPLVFDFDRTITIWGNDNKLYLDVEDNDFYDDDWMIRVEDGTTLVLRHVVLNGFLDDEDEDVHLEGLVWVEENGTINAENNLLENAKFGFHVNMDKEDFDVKDAENMIKSNVFKNIVSTNRVVFYDGTEEIFPVPE